MAHPEYTRAFWVPGYDCLQETGNKPYLAGGNAAGKSELSKTLRELTVEGKLLRRVAERARCIHVLNYIKTTKRTRTEGEPLEKSTREGVSPMLEIFMRHHVAQINPSAPKLCLDTGLPPKTSMGRKQLFEHTHVASLQHVFHLYSAVPLFVRIDDDELIEPFRAWETRDMSRNYFRDGEYILKSEHFISIAMFQ